jgi:hypothetical protein
MITAARGAPIESRSAMGTAALPSSLRTAGLDVRRQLAGRLEPRKVLRISEELLIGRVSAAEHFQGTFGQKAALSALGP